MRKFFYIICMFLSGIIYAQDIISQDLIINDYVEGTLLLPAKKSKTVAIIIPGSGPTDRDGNQNFMKNNSLKFLAQDIATQGIATFRYDKRVLTLLKKRRLNEKNIRFDDFVNDAKHVVKYMKLRRRFEKIYIIGHSQGSLVGMLAANENVDGFISIAGAGQSIDKTVLNQIKVQMNNEVLTESAKKSFAIMKTGKVDKDFNPGLANIFNLGVQPFMISWMKHDPCSIIKKLSIPVLIINGSKDLQVPLKEAEMLKEAKPEAQYEVIEKMNHVLKTVEGDDQENSKTYNLPRLKNDTTLAGIITTFIKKH